MSIAYEIAIKRAESGVDLRGSEGCCIKKDASGKLVLCADGDTTVLGVIHVGGDKGEPTDYFLPNYSGVVRVKLHASSGKVTEGGKLMVAANGQHKAATASGTVVAIAQEDGNAGELIEAILAVPSVVAAGS